MPTIFEIESHVPEEKAKAWAKSWRTKEDAFEEDEDDEVASNDMDVGGLWAFQLPVFAERFGVDGPFNVHIFTSSRDARSYNLWAMFDFNAVQGFFKFADNHRPGVSRIPFEWRGNDTMNRSVIPNQGLIGWIEFLDEDELRGYLEGPDLGRFTFEGRRLQRGGAVVAYPLITQKWEELKAQVETVSLAAAFGSFTVSEPRSGLGGF